MMGMTGFYNMFTYNFKLRVMCEMTSTIDKSITDEQLKKIYENASKSKTTDYAYFLRLTYFKNRCMTPVYEEDFSTLFGDAKFIKIGEFEDACKKEEEYVIIPQSTEVVIGFFQTEEEKKLVKIYTFSFHRGWRILEV